MPAPATKPFSSPPKVQSPDGLSALVKAYNPAADTDLIRRAYAHCKSAHTDQKRHSGEPYYTHPVNVAEILAGLRMDVASVCTALLHDVLEDTETTEKMMRAEFGDEITTLVKGVTKLGQLELSREDLSREGKQAENFQKFVQAMSKEVRVLLVKLCDRLHNMRTLQYHPKAASRERISRETMDIYAPLARKIGVDRICTELEDLSFKFINPSAFDGINTRLDRWRAAHGTQISELSLMLREVLRRHDVGGRVFGREKRAFAIWRKLQRQGIAFEDVADIYAFRIVVDSEADCYRILGILHREWRCVASRFRDFISVPKPNGYRSLHTTILGPDSQRVEIQIRTEEMHEVAERGVAAHWHYKNDSYIYDNTVSGAADPTSRLRPLVEMMEHSGTADEFFEHAKLEMYADQVFTFTPKGQLIALPRDATPIDFAYAVHTEIGDTCIGAIVNGRSRPLRHRLRNGDVVKIIRGGRVEPQPGWEELVVTGKARSAVRRLNRETEKAELRRTGRRLADHAFIRAGKEFSETLLDDALTRLNFETPGTLYEALGRGVISPAEFMAGVFPDGGTDQPDPYANRDLIDDNTARLYIKGRTLEQGAPLLLGLCCHPIKGDRIVGVHDERRGVVIHKIDCETLAADEDNAAEWIDLGWRRAADQTNSMAQIDATIEHVPGALGAVTSQIGESGGNVTNIKTIKRSPSFFDMLIDVEVTDAAHLARIVAAMRASPYVVNVQRS